MAIATFILAVIGGLIEIGIAIGLIVLIKAIYEVLARVDRNNEAIVDWLNASTIKSEKTSKLIIEALNKMLSGKLRQDSQLMREATQAVKPHKEYILDLEYAKNKFAESSYEKGVLTKIINRINKKYEAN